jgi:Flp pilus assembly protein protease CpaA
MKAINVAIGMFFTMSFMGAGCVSIFAAIYQAMGGNLIIAGAFFILCVCCWVLMLITLNTIMMDSGYPSSFTGNRTCRSRLSDTGYKANSMYVPCKWGTIPSRRRGDK